MEKEWRLLLDEICLLRSVRWTPVSVYPGRALSKSLKHTCGIVDEMELPVTANNWEVSEVSDSRVESRGASMEEDGRLGRISFTCTANIVLSICIRARILVHGHVRMRTCLYKCVYRHLPSYGGSTMMAMAMAVVPCSHGGCSITWIDSGQVAACN